MGGVVEQGQGEVFINFHALHVVVQRAVEHSHKVDRVHFIVGEQRAHAHLRHEHQHAAFQPVAGHVADADLDLAVVLQHIVIIPAHLVRWLHVGSNLQPFNL